MITGSRAFGMMANAKRIISDTFTRADGSLGTSSSGHLWSVLRGTWSISSNKATSSDAGSSYALATVDIGAQNVNVSADITDGGPGLAFWVTDANSWWASSVNYKSVQTGQAYYTNSSRSVQTGQAYYTGSLEGGQQLTQGYYAGTTCTTQAYYSGSTVITCPPGKSYISHLGTCCNVAVLGGTTVYSNCTAPSTPCNGPGGNATSGGGNCGTLTAASTGCFCPGGNSSSGGGNCGTYTAPTYAAVTCTGAGGNSSSGGGNCGTLVQATYTTVCDQPGGNATSGGGDCGTLVAATFNYITELKLYNNTSGTISTVSTQQINSNSSAYSKVNSIKASTSGNSITVSGYSNAGLSSQLGSSLSNTPTSPTKSTKVGIVKTPSDANAGSVIDNFAAENVL
jgi:hypothetical protein